MSDVGPISEADLPGRHMVDTEVERIAAYLNVIAEHRPEVVFQDAALTRYFMMAEEAIELGSSAAALSCRLRDSFGPLEVGWAANSSQTG